MDTNGWNMVFGIIGTIGTILGIVGIVLSIRSVRKKEPVYSIKSNNLISGSASTLENLNITYQDHKVQNLTVSKILFYNRGAETINRQDIETIHHIGIGAEECEILDGSVLQVNNRSNNFTATYRPDSKSVFIDFDYLDKNQGAVIQIVHTGVSSEHLIFHGDIKGVQKLIQVPPEKFRRPPKLRASFVEFLLKCSLALIASTLMIIGGMISEANRRIVPIIVIIAFFIFDFIPDGFRIMRGSMIPKGLEKFDE